jgi:ATP-binding cassette, subfamily A (ABC1), member 3
VQDALKHSSSRNIVAFVDNGMQGGEISRVINTVSETVNQAGKTAMTFNDTGVLFQHCASNSQGVSPCFAAIVFRSSPSEPEQGGYWNYSYITDNSLGRTIDVTKSTNDVQIYGLPLQHAVDNAIQGKPINTTTDVLQRLYTPEKEETRLQHVESNYFDLVITLVGVFFFFSLLEITYHLPGHIAFERELGVTQLIDSMMPARSMWKPQFVRLASTYISFVMVYSISWLVVGVVIGTVAFPRTSAAIPILYHLLNGLALTASALLGGVFFRRAQLSGVVFMVITLVMAILPQAIGYNKQTHAMVVALCLLFPSSNYTYMILSIARFEQDNRKANLLQGPPVIPMKSIWSIQGYLLFVFLLLQIVFYPLAAAVVERALYGTASTNRKVLAEKSDDAIATVQLRNFSKV